MIFIRDPQNILRSLPFFIGGLKYIGCFQSYFHTLIMQLEKTPNVEQCSIEGTVNVLSLAFRKLFLFFLFITIVLRRTDLTKRKWASKEFFLLTLPSQEQHPFCSQLWRFAASQILVAFSNNLQLVKLQRSRN